MSTTEVLLSPTKGLQEEVGVFETAEKQRNVAYEVTTAEARRFPSPPISWRAVTTCCYRKRKSQTRKRNGARKKEGGDAGRVKGLVGRRGQAITSRVVNPNESGNKSRRDLKMTKAQQRRAGAPPPTQPN